MTRAWVRNSEANWYHLSFRPHSISPFRQLELLDRHQLDALAAKDDIQGELVARFEKYLQLAASYRRGALVAEQAAKHVRSPAPSERLKALGTVLL
ncbi:MAG: hypothetical protein CM1200mP39_23790 [Dehalococcoidia bacterium]|nr:MAG: hypothetical protein CM1200mP39_23790 [Dehalococcoidia bacterium]